MLKWKVKPNEMVLLRLFMDVVELRYEFGRADTSSADSCDETWHNRYLIHLERLEYDE